MKAEEMRKHIRSFRGKIKLNTGGKPFTEWWAEYKREEKGIGRTQISAADGSG